MNTNTPPVISHTDDPHCVCAECRSARWMRLRLARRRERAFNESHTVDPQILADRR